MLTLIKERVEKRGRHYFGLYLCSCGTRVVVRSADVRNGYTKNCKICGKRRNTESQTKFSTNKNGFDPVPPNTTTTHKREYKSWINMIHRCYNKNTINYDYYGGRGIEVCDRWRNSFINFLEDMGERPPGTSLDRIDVNGNYGPSNCKWSTPKEQAGNKRTKNKDL